jgi:hypothetical protein
MVSWKFNGSMNMPSSPSTFLQSWQNLQSLLITTSSFAVHSIVQEPQEKAERFFGLVFVKPHPGAVVCLACLLQRQGEVAHRLKPTHSSESIRDMPIAADSKIAFAVPGVEFLTLQRRIHPRRL